MTVNDVVWISVEHDGEHVTFTIPAFTQSMREVGKSVESHLQDYADISLEQESPVSVGDFILWLIRRASEVEPLESQYDDDSV